MIGKKAGIPILGELPFMENVATDSFNAEWVSRLEPKIHSSLFSQSG